MTIKKKHIAIKYGENLTRIQKVSGKRGKSHNLGQMKKGRQRIRWLTCISEETVSFPLCLPGLPRRMPLSSSRGTLSCLQHTENKETHQRLWVNDTSNCKWTRDKIHSRTLQEKIKKIYISFRSHESAFKLERKLCGYLWLPGQQQGQKTQQSPSLQPPGGGYTAGSIGSLHPEQSWRLLAVTSPLVWRPCLAPWQGQYGSLSPGLPGQNGSPACLKSLPAAGDPGQDQTLRDPLEDPAASFSLVPTESPGPSSGRRRNWRRWFRDYKS